MAPCGPLDPGDIFSRRCALLTGIGLFGLAYGMAGLGNPAGPSVGGLLTQTLGWRSIFWLLVPFALVSFVIGALTVPEC
jgi:MFS family permease